MSYCCRVILPADLDEILNFETLKLAESLTDDTERTLASWHARWRRESLEHYLPLGWSFLVRDQDIKNSFAAANPGEGALVGYFLASLFYLLKHSRKLFGWSICPLVPCKLEMSFAIWPTE